MPHAMVSRELLDRCRRREAGAFEELVERTHRQVYTLAHRLMGDRYEAEDVAQDVYLRVYRSLHGFRGDAAFETWLYRITSNVAMRHLRRRNRFGDPNEEPTELLRVPPAEPEVEETGFGDEVRRALDLLTPGQRAVLVLRDVYGFSTAEVAAQMGTTEGAVKVRLHRARRAMKELIYGAAEAGHAEVHDRLPEYVEESHA